MAKTKPVVLEPTMGPSSDAYQMLCNVVSRGGSLERRPRIVATEMGYSTNFGVTTGATAETVDGKVFSPEWRVTSVIDATLFSCQVPGRWGTGFVLNTYPVGVEGPHSNSDRAYYNAITTATKWAKAGAVGTGSTNYKTISNVSFMSSSGDPFTNASVTTPDTSSLSVGDKIVLGVSPHADDEYKNSRTLHDVNICLEGIDCEIIQGKIVALYVGKFVEAATLNGHADNTDLYFYHSYHDPGDPRVGYVRDANIYGTTTDDLPFQWYQQAAYWNRRIVPTYTDYMITGHNVGPLLVGGNASASINERDSVSLFTGFPLKMFGTNDTVDAISRLDPFASFYSLYSPKNAFAHVDRHSGQVIWYGFLDGENYALNGTLPAEDVILMESTGDISNARDTLIVRPYHIWYSEPGSPLSLSVVGWIPLTIGSHNKEIVGMADFRNGTAIFSHDTIHFMRGIGADTGSNAAARVVIGDGIGSDSPWSIKPIGEGVAFANTKGLYYLDRSGQVNEISGFRELFGSDGISCKRGPYHSYFDDTTSSDWNDSGDDLKRPMRAEPESGSYADLAYNTFDSHPWRVFKIDKSRINRAVAGVWDDLYLLFVSLDGDPYGEDNRLCLCWNWKESGAPSPRQAWRAGPTSVWLLPKNMGVRGWAYDGSLSTPFVMTRYGLAKFELNTGPDVCWTNTGSLNAVTLNETTPDFLPKVDVLTGEGYLNSIHASKPMPFILGQSRWMPETGDSFVTTNMIVQHETKHDVKQAASETWVYESYSETTGTVNYSGSSPTTGAEGGDVDNQMSIRIWGMQGEMLLSEGQNPATRFTFGKMRFTKCDIPPLQNLVARNSFKLWRGRHAQHHRHNYAFDTGFAPTEGDTQGEVRLPKSIRRASSARSGFSASRCAMQFSTASPDKILSVQAIMDSVAPRGEGA